MFYTMVQITRNLNGTCMPHVCNMHTADTKMHGTSNHACTRMLSATYVFKIETVQHMCLCLCTICHRIIFFTTRGALILAKFRTYVHGNIVLGKLLLMLNSRPEHP